MKLHNAIMAACVAAGSISPGLPAFASGLDAPDFCDRSIALPKSIREMYPMPDGSSYACVSDDEKRIETYSYKNGAKTGTLFDVDAIKGDLKISDFDGYQLSANGKKLLLWNGTSQIYRHSFKAEYYVYDILRSTLAKVSDKGLQQGATMSHDGRMVAYQRDNNIFIANIDYGTDIPITKDGEINSIINGTSDWAYEEEFAVVNTMRWSHDDAVLAYVKFDESEVPAYSFDDYKSYCTGADSADPYPGSYTYKYPLAGYPNSVVSVHAYDLDTRITKTMDLPIAATDYVPSVEFAGNTKDLMVMILNRDQNRLRLMSVNAASTVAREVLVQQSDAWLSPAAYGMVEYSGKSFVIGSEASGYRHLYEYDYNGRLLKQITKGDFNVTAYYGYDPKRNCRFVQTTSLGAINRNVARVDAGGKLTLLHNVQGTESASFSKTFDFWVRKYSSAKVPDQYSICTADGKLVKMIEDNAAYAEKYACVPKMEFLKVPNATGEEMNAYIIKPAGFQPGKKYPLMMYQYNGPDSQEVTNRWRMEGIFYVASQGYVVAAVDGRGTGNRSREWATAVYKNLGKYETADQLAGAKYFAAMPYVDADRTSCFGWSYGGYMTLMELSHADCNFKCGVSMAPVTDWRFYDSIYTERYMLTPQQNPDGYDAASALARTPQMNRDLLIMSGTNDDNVHFYNTLMYTSKLNFEGKLFDMMAFSGFEHSLPLCNARTQLFRKVVQYLDAHLQNDRNPGK